MSTAKRSRNAARPASPGQSSSKRLKSSHVPASAAKKEGLGFLVDEDARQGRKLEGKLTNGLPGRGNAKVDETKATVAEKPSGESRRADEVIDISSAEEESSEDENEEEDAPKQLQANGYAGEAQAVAGAEDVDMVDGDAAEQDAEEPSFGDMLSTRHPEPIEVAAAYPNDQPDSRSIAPTGGNVLSAPTGTSLSTVLTQALRTNDKDLLETCFQMNDQQSIRTTIQRLQPHLVGPLMQRLAERIHRRPGRTGHLMTWIQWSLVAHGGYLATQPDIMRKLRSLNQVLRERAQGLQPLLQLKGKLDMLGAQLELRRQTLATSTGAALDDEDDEEGVLYIEGRDDDDASESDEAAAPRSSVKSFKTAPAELEYHTASSEDEEADSDAEALPNGVTHDDDESADDDEDDDARQGMFDIEAEESDEEDGEDAGSEDEDDSSASSVDDGADHESDASDEITVKHPKPQVLNRKR